MNIGINATNAVSQNLKYDIRSKQNIQFKSVLMNKSENINECDSNEELVGRYTDGSLGFYAEVYEQKDNSSLYKIKTRYDDGREEIREVDMESLETSNCNIVDLFAKLKYIEKNKNVDNLTIEHVISHIYMDKRLPKANSNTNIDFKKWFAQQLELERQQGNEFRTRKLEQLLMYL